MLVWYERNTRWGGIEIHSDEPFDLDTVALLMSYGWTKHRFVENLWYKSFSYDDLKFAQELVWRMETIGRRKIEQEEEKEEEEEDCRYLEYIENNYSSNIKDNMRCVGEIHKWISRRKAIRYYTTNRKNRWKYEVGYYGTEIISGEMKYHVNYKRDMLPLLLDFGG